MLLNPGLPLLSTQIGKLTGLTELTLTGLRLAGSLVSELGDLSALRVLALDRNSFVGTVPTELARLRLTSISLRDNPELTGSFGLMATASW